MEQAEAGGCYKSVIYSNMAHNYAETMVRVYSAEKPGPVLAHTIVSLMSFHVVFVENSLSIVISIMPRQLCRTLS